MYSRPTNRFWPIVPRALSQTVRPTWTVRPALLASTILAATGIVSVIGAAKASETITGTSPNQTLIITGDRATPIVFRRSPGTGQFDTDAISVLDIAGASTVDPAADGTAISVNGRGGIRIFGGETAGPAITATGQNAEGIAIATFGRRSGADAENELIEIVVSGDVTGGGTGIRAGTTGPVDVDIRAGNVTGNSDTGIAATVQMDTSLVPDLEPDADIAIRAGNVEGHEYGVLANHFATGSITITVVDATGTNSEGILALIDSYNAVGDMTITSSGDVTGGTNGMKARNYGDGSLSISAVNVTGNGGHGIYSKLGNSESEGSLTIAASGAVVGSDIGVYATNSAIGGLSISVSQVTGQAGHGVYGHMTNESARGDVTITASGDISGAADGIFARNDGSGDIRIIVSGDVSGADDGIEVGENTYPGHSNSASATVELNSGASVFSNAATITEDTRAILFSPNDDRLALGAGGLIGENTVPGQVSDDGLVDFGAGTDTLELKGTGVQFEHFGNFIGLERLEVTTGQWTISGDSALVSIANRSTGSLALTGSTGPVADLALTGGGLTVSNALSLREGGKVALGGAAASQALASDTPAISAGDFSISGSDSVSVTLPVSFTRGTLVFVKDTGGTDIAVFADRLSATSSPITSWIVGVGATTSEIVVTARMKSTSEIASELGMDEGSAGALVAALEAMTPGGEVDVALTDILTNGADSEIRRAAEQLGVQRDTLSAMPQLAAQIADDTADILSTRMRVLRGTEVVVASLSGIAGFATGDLGRAYAVWAKPFATIVDQDARDGVVGYSSDTAGIAFGIDREIGDDFMLGAAGSWSRTDVDGDGAGGSRLQIDSYQVALYGDVDMGAWYAEGSMGYARNSYDSQRRIDFGGLNRLARADYTGDQTIARIDAGLPLDLSGSVMLTPRVGLFWTRLGSVDYTESGADGISQTVKTEANDVLIASAGAALNWRYSLAGGDLTPEVRLGVGYDLAGDTAVATGRFTGGGATFQSIGPEPERFSVDSGLGLSFEANGWSIGAAYDVEAKSGFLSQSGQIEAKLRF